MGKLELGKRKFPILNSVEMLRNISPFTVDVETSTPLTMGLDEPQATKKAKESTKTKVLVNIDKFIDNLMRSEASVGVS